MDPELLQYVLQMTMLGALPMSNKSEKMAYSVNVLHAYLLASMNKPCSYWSTDADYYNCVIMLIISLFIIGHLIGSTPPASMLIGVVTLGMLLEIMTSNA